MHHKQCEYTPKVQFFVCLCVGISITGCNSPWRLEKLQGHTLIFSLPVSQRNQEYLGP